MEGEHTCLFFGVLAHEYSDLFFIFICFSTELFVFADYGGKKLTLTQEQKVNIGANVIKGQVLIQAY